MKRIINTIFFMFVLISVSTLYAETNHSIDTQKSKISWVGKKVAGQHDGFLSLKEGSVSVVDGTVVSGEFVIDMNSIENHDLADDLKYKNKLENHLKADDFFNVVNFPEAKFVLNSAVNHGDGKYSFTGDLTVKSFTHPITFDGTVVKAEGVFHAQAKTVIDRSKWEIKHNSKSFFDIKKLGDHLIYDEIEIGLDLYTK